MDTIRTFIALELPPDIRDALGQAQTEIQQADPGSSRSVKWVSPDGIHLTLKFLGDAPANKIDAITAAIGQACARSGELSLILDHAGCFPNLRQPRVLWIGVSGDVDALGALQAAVEETVSPLGFPGESRRFSPHLTLGRVRDDASPEERARLGRAVQALHGASHSFTVTHCSLMRSDLLPGGAVYTRLAEAALGG